jgi:hypothetical protein
MAAREALIKCQRTFLCKEAHADALFLPNGGLEHPARFHVEYEIDGKPYVRDFLNNWGGR